MRERKQASRTSGDKEQPEPDGVRLSGRNEEGDSDLQLVFIYCRGSEARAGGSLLLCQNVQIIAKCFPNGPGDQV
jgi:hypothetical protein